jgi:arabinose-5-phosphate isomerase
MNILEQGKQTIKREAEALGALSQELDHSFEEAIKVIVGTCGRLIVVGVGKSGHIGQKIASTLSSTGTPSLFVHPTEASHGDLGMIRPEDVVLAISRSGESPELIDVLEYCRRVKIPIIAITSSVTSSLACAATVTLRLPNVGEACPLGLAPTSSTIMSLAIGDALAIACLQIKRFTSSDFKNYHPGGKLGKKLKRVADLMHTGESVPLVSEKSTVTEGIIEMTRCTFGCVGVINNDGRLTGIFTDGDLRRKLSPKILEENIKVVMTELPLSLGPDSLAQDALILFSEKRVPSCFITENEKPIGIIHLHDLTRIGLI